MLPCISPWGFEMIQRWTPNAVDPNRYFKAGKEGCLEAAFAMKFISENVANSAGILMHTDLHETTDTDNSELCPARFARDGEVNPQFDEIPDGFYLVANDHCPEPEWQRAIIEAVAKITHIAPPDSKGTIIGEIPTDHGVVTIAGRAEGLCGGHTDARFTTTTEVYPDSPTATPEECNEAQCCVVVTGINKALEMTKQA